MLQKRVIEPQLLDHADPAAAGANLRDLVRINKRFGGPGVLEKLLAKVADEQDKFTVLDVGAASGDTAEFIKRYPIARLVSVRAAFRADELQTLARAAGLPEL